MAFNLLDLKKEQDSKQEKKYIRHLVVGEDLFAVAEYLYLKEKFGEEEVALLSERAFSRDDLLPLGPSALRGPANIQKLKQLYPELEIREKNGPALFYKELKWREFGGRAKSEKLLRQEAFYTQKRADIDVEELFTFLKDENLLEELNQQSWEMKVTGLTQLTPEDLAEPAFFELQCSNGVQARCEHLYWAKGPRLFLSLYQDKNDLSDELMQFCEETQAPCPLYIRFNFKAPVTDKRETLFIPLSYTHEWGHFIGEFSPEKDGVQQAQFVTFIEPDHTNEEDVSKKIRLLKRSLEKIFKNFSGISYQEFIKLNDWGPCLKIDDLLYQKVQKELGNIHWISVNAPLEDLAQVRDNFEYSVNDLAFFSRAATRFVETQSLP
jgi:hypothetical protein